MSPEFICAGLTLRGGPTDRVVVQTIKKTSTIEMNKNVIFIVLYSVHLLQNQIASFKCHFHILFMNHNVNLVFHNRNPYF